MQQTEKYKLNLIESSDPFLPDALNINTQKVEDAMSAHEAAVAQEVAAVSDRVAVFEAKHFAFGTYQGISTNTYVLQKIELGFTPKMVIVTDRGGLTALFAAEGHDEMYLKIVENGFTVDHEYSLYGGHPFIAFD